jgi:hypothetical protein
MLRPSLILPPALLVALVCAFAACKAAPRPFPDPQRPPPVPVRVAFEPPVDEPIVERSVITRLQREPEGELRERVEAVTHSVFERQDGQFILTQTVPELRVLQNGEAVDNPLMKVVTGLRLRLLIAQDGSFIRLLNPEEVEPAVRQAFPAAAEADEVLRVFTPEALETQAKEEWSSRYGELFERNLVPGTAWYEVETLETFGGQVPYLVERQVEGTRPTRMGRELVVRLTCPASPRAALDPERALLALQAAGVEVLGGAVCEGEQVVALEPFVPRSTLLEVRAGGVLLRREVVTQTPGEVR